MRVVFPYLGQLHQVFHSLPIAAQVAARHPHVEVHAAATSPGHLAFIRDLLTKYAPAAPVKVHALARPILESLGAKKRTIIKNRAYLRAFDAIVTPERTSLFMRQSLFARQLGLDRVRLIWTRHGAGDRAVGFAPDVDQFDYVLLAGPKIEARLLGAGLIHPGRYTGGVYAKFDWLLNRPTRRRWFANDLPTVLYNPHFQPALSSWPAYGMAVLDFFAASGRYNLIFAPHVRLFDPPTPAKYRAFERFANHPNLRIDLGSEHGVDMSYVDAADLYLGDVSSQVAEFVFRPRPCVFIDAHGVSWQNDPNYSFWALGPVIRDAGSLGSTLDAALAHPDAFAQVQEQYVADTFGIAPGISSAARGADAIVDFLENSGAG
jgi:hypothetical protein